MKPYYEHAGITIYHGDCRDVLPSLEPVPLTVTDPPYPHYTELGWKIPCVASVLGPLREWGTLVVFWPPNLHAPLPQPQQEHIWNKPHVYGHHYEKVFVYGSTSGRCKVWREMAILPNYNHCKEEFTEHPTQKPMALMMAILAEYDGNTVLDPFMGSGTTLRAAKDLSRKAIGIEIEERYCEIAAERLSQEVLNL